MRARVGGKAKGKRRPGTRGLRAARWGGGYGVAVALEPIVVMGLDRAEMGGGQGVAIAELVCGISNMRGT